MTPDGLAVKGIGATRFTRGILMSEDSFSAHANSCLTTLLEIPDARISVAALR